MLTKFKLWIWAAVAALLGGMAVVIKLLGSRNKKLKSTSEYLEARVHRDRAIMERDNELEGQRASRRAEVRNSDRIARNPDKLWDDDSSDT